MVFRACLERVNIKLPHVFSVDFTPLVAGKILARLWVRGKFRLLDWRKIAVKIRTTHLC